MYNPIIVRFLKPSLLVLLLIFTGPVARSSRKSVSTSPAESPMRLRLKVERNTLRSGESTRVTAEFVDRFYQQVPNDGLRLVQFGFASPGGQKGDGTLSPVAVNVKAGQWSAATAFTARQTGRVIITVSAQGLDSAQTVLVVTRPASSFLSQLIEPVAFADNYKFDMWPRNDLRTEANGNSRITFHLNITPAPPSERTIRVRVDPPATIIYEGKDRGTQTEIALSETNAVSDDVNVISGTAGSLNVRAQMIPDGQELIAPMEFTAPHPSRVRFCEDVNEIISTQHTIPISIELTDDSGNPLQADTEKRIKIKAANDDDPVSFEPESVVFAPSHNQFFAQSMLRLKGLPQSGELTFLALPDDVNLKAGRITFKVQSPVKGISLAGPAEVVRGKNAVEYVVRLTDKDGKPVAADWQRTIKLYASYGKFTPDEVTIPKDQDAARVRYEPAGTTGVVSLRAESGSLKEGAQNIVLVTALQWLFMAALLGGLIGGAVRYFAMTDKSGPAPPPVNWRGLVGIIVGSVISGLFLYLAMRLGLSRALGALALPFDYGTWLVAFFFGGVGGSAGPMVFERLTMLFLPATKPAPVAAS